MKVNIILTFFILGMAQSRDDRHEWEILDKNGISYRVYRGNHYSVTNPLRVLNKTAVFDLNGMESLSLFHSGIEKIEPGTLTNLTNLKTFVISTGNLKHIPSGIFNNLNITKLELTECSIKTIAGDAFLNMRKLKEINLDHNQLRKWVSEWFINTPSLTNVSINFNLIEEIPASVLVGGDLEYNILLKKNNISKVSNNAFRGIRKIRLLDLSENGIEHFNGSYLVNSNIEELKLNDNKISCFDENQFRQIFVAKLTDLRGNPWKFECLQKVRNWIQGNNKNVSL